MYEILSPSIMTWQYAQFILGGVVGVILAFAQAVVRMSFTKSKS